jgi:hypothetical protein
MRRCFGGKGREEGRKEERKTEKKRNDKIQARFDGAHL